MTMVIFFHSSVEGCDGDNRVSSRKAVCLSNPKAMAYLQEKEEVCSSYSSEERKDDHGLLPPFISGKLRWRPWPMPSSSREEWVCPSSSKRERSMTMA